jgi:hypothetical protein
MICDVNMIIMKAFEDNIEELFLIGTEKSQVLGRLNIYC